MAIEAVSQEATYSALIVKIQPLQGGVLGERKTPRERRYTGSRGERETEQYVHGQL